MAKKQREEEAGYNFMDTYGDMVTLLLTFFILLFSMSSVDADKWEVLVKAFSRNKDANTTQIVMIPEGDGDDVAPSVGTEPLKSEHRTDVESDPTIPADLSQLAELIQQYIEENELSESVKVESEGENSVYLTFDNNLFFDGDSAVLRQSSYDILDFLGGMFKSLEDQILVVRINGHTAEIPNMPDYRVNDWDLSSMRANRVATYFETKQQFPPKKLMTNGWGKNHPVESNDTAEGRAANRRVDIQVLGNDFDRGNPQELLGILEKTLDVDLFSDSTPDPTITPPEDITSDKGTAGQDIEREAEEDNTSEVTLAVGQEEAPPVTEPVDQAQVDAALKALEEEAAKQRN